VKRSGFGVVQAMTVDGSHLASASRRSAATEGLARKLVT
jgi:hypothetical protein